MGTLYVLDEPSIGLHSRDTNRLIKILQDLRDLGNTILVVEHDPDIMRTADRILDLGPAFQTTVMFFIEKGFRLSTEDMLRSWKEFITAEEESLRSRTVGDVYKRQEFATAVAVTLVPSA